MPEEVPTAALALLVVLALVVGVRSVAMRTRRPPTRARPRMVADEQQVLRDTLKLRIWQGVMRGELASAAGVRDSAPSDGPGQPMGHAAPAVATVGSDNGAVRVDDQVRTVREGTSTSTRTHLNDPVIDPLDERRAVYGRVQIVEGWRRWRGSFDEDGYPRVWLTGRGYEKVHRLVYTWEQGPIPFGWTVDHHCGEKDCLDHLEAVTVGTNTSRRHARERGELPTGHAGLVPPVREGTTQPAAGVASVQTEPGPASPTPAPAEAATGASIAPTPVVSSRRGLGVEQRRAEVQRLRAQGWSLRRIAEQLGISLGTAHADAAAGVQSGVQRVQLERPAEHPHSTPHGAAPEVRRDAGEPAEPGEPPHNAVVNLSGGTDGVQVTIALFERYDRPAVEQRTVNLEELVDLLTTFDELADKRQARCWSPTRYADGTTSRANAGVEAVSCLVFDCDRVAPDWARLEGYWYLAHTTYQHTSERPRWRVVLPLAAPVLAQQWPPVWRRAHAALCPEADPNCKDPSRQYYLPGHPAGVLPEARCHEGRLLDPATLPQLPPEPEPSGVRHLAPLAALREPTTRERRRGQAYLAKLIDELARVPAGGRNAALNKTAWKLGQWVAAGALDQDEVEDALYGAAERNGLVADDGAHQCWATIRSGLSAGLQRPVDLAADDQPPGWRRRRTPRRRRRRT